MRKLVAGIEVVDDTIWDMVVDRIQDAELFQIALLNASRSTVAKAAHAALKRAGVFHGETGIEFINIISGSDNKIMCYHMNKWQDCEAMQHKRYTRVLEAYLASIVKGKTVDIRGFLEIKKGETKFKLLDKEKHQAKKNSRQGSVCVATTSYSIENMRQRIGAIVDDTESKLSQFGALNKLCLCNTYEYWLRKASNATKNVYFLNKVAYALFKNLPQKN